jgi:hypothetical protein
MSLAAGTKIGAFEIVTSIAIAEALEAAHDESHRRDRT